MIETNAQVRNLVVVTATANVLLDWVGVVHTVASRNQFFFSLSPSFPPTTPLGSGNLLNHSYALQPLPAGSDI